MISAPVTAFAVVPTASASYRVAILCFGPLRRFVLRSDTSGVGGEADMTRELNRRVRPEADLESI
jgi:hypothetical protein